MNKLFVIFLMVIVTFVAMGCVAPTSVTGAQVSSAPPVFSGRTRFPWFHRSLFLTIEHTCTEQGKVYWYDQMNQKTVTNINGVLPTDVYPHPFSADREVRVFVQSLDNNGRVVATFSEQFPVTDYSDRAQTWLISDNYGGRWDRQTTCRSGGLR